eukprot:scaffold24862_cov30-Phaeocystis_antarctica.AAC.1
MLAYLLTLTFTLTRWWSCRASKAPPKKQLATAQLQQREATTKLAAAKATSGTGTSTDTGCDGGGGGGGEGGGLAQELAAAQRGLQAAQKGLAAETGHSAEYRRLAQLAEGDKAEQLRLSAEFKAALEAQLATAEEA